VSNFVKTKISEAHPELEKNTTTIYNFSRRFSQHNYMGNYFLYFGRLSREKGLLNLLKAFKKLEGLQLKIVGDGELKKEIEEEKSINVDLVGYKSGIELEKIIQNAFFVIASSECYETNSMVIVESYSVGKPVIGAKIGAIPELIIENKTGFLFDSKNLESLVNALLHSTTISRSEYENMGNNAFKFAKEKFSPDQHYDLLQNVYERSILLKKTELKL
jgi:glycosyltransferase involved in cell wall biosynthesis